MTLSAFNTVLQREQGTWSQVPVRSNYLVRTGYLVSQSEMWVAVGGAQSLQYLRESGDPLSAYDGATDLTVDGIEDIFGFAGGVPATIYAVGRGNVWSCEPKDLGRYQRRLLITPVGNPPSVERLYGVWANSVSELWAVGEHVENGHAVGLVLIGDPVRGQWGVGALGLPLRTVWGSTAGTVLAGGPKILYEIKRTADMIKLTNMDNLIPRPIPLSGFNWTRIFGLGPERYGALATDGTVFLAKRTASDWVLSLEHLRLTGARDIWGRDTPQGTEWWVVGERGAILHRAAR